jgi:hypothetical protein
VSCKSAAQFRPEVNDEGREREREADRAAWESGASSRLERLKSLESRSFFHKTGAGSEVEQTHRNQVQRKSSYEQSKVKMNQKSGFGALFKVK